MKETLIRALERVRHARPARGRGIEAARLLIGRLHSGALVLDEKDATLLVHVLESLCYEIDDERAQARRNLQITSRTISAAIRGGFRG